MDWDKAAGVVFLFGAAGPPIGSAVFGIPIAMVILVSGEESPLAALVVILFLVVASYFIGFVPACVTGILAAIYREYLSRWRNCLCVGVLAVVVEITFLIATLGSPSDFLDLDGLVAVLWLFGLPSLLSGTVTARICGHVFNESEGSGSVTDPLDLCP